MRLTILLNGPSPQTPHESRESCESCDYAVLWLDTEERRWSREAHEGVDLPPWGRLRQEHGVTMLCSAGNDAPLCTLYDLSVTTDADAADAATCCQAQTRGPVAWSGLSGRHVPIGGSWQLQAIDRQRVRAEHSVFAHWR
ncbi:DUF3564 family protein [Paraburkholderia hayleyella]|uniref:DUF3564 family protein n=1 Tax=Paraburkholderia hayleyella TaxID=2152889 RepID=UPI001290C108|nr:DUF3564 family protein [Paraburkholderia hayleyella]